MMRQAQVDKSRRGMSVALLLAGAAPLALPSAAQAQASATEAEQEFAVPAGPLSQALQAYSAVTGVQLVYSSELVEAKQSPGARGRMTRRDALMRILAGTGLSGSLSGNTATISGGTSEDERVTGFVRVEGAQGSAYFGGAGQAAGVNGVNGSRDITATEGTGSLTSGALTIGSKVPQAIKDVPQSVSVLTSELLEQRNVTDFTSAMRQLPGITLVQEGSSLESSFYSRGFRIESFQIDGGAPLITGNYNLGSIGYFPQIDMSQYDHVELQRGPSGTFNGFGGAGGTVNLVRKKPLDHAQVGIEAQIGSWDNYRFVFDASSPLALDGRLRGRVVVTYQDNDHFYRLAHDNKTLLYGIAELDLTPSTLVTAGLSHSRQDSLPWLYGFPRYQNGEDLGLPRSASFALPWNRWNFDTTEFFGSVEQNLGGEWSAKISLTHNHQDSIRKGGSLSAGGVNPLTGGGVNLNGDYNNYRTEQISGEVTVHGAFEMFGQRQEITLGANRVSSDGSGQLVYLNLISTYLTPYQPYPGGPIFCQDFGSGVCPTGSIQTALPVDVFNFDPFDPLYTEPANTLPYSRYTDLKGTQTGAYINLRLTAFDRLHALIGLRWSSYKNEDRRESLCTSIPATDPGHASCFGKNIGDPYSATVSNFKDEHISWPPSASLSYDVTPSLTTYLAYSDIYQSQATNRTASGRPIDPITGSNLEAGIKWAPRDGRFNLSLAAYRIDRKGFADVDPNFPPYQEIEPGIYCCFIPNPNLTQRSQGIDLEASGEVHRGLQILASYTYNDNTQIGDQYGSGDGLPFASIQPKHLYKLWLSYNFGANDRSDMLSALTISGGVNGQSAAYYSGQVCVNFTPPDPVTGNSFCRGFGPPDVVPFEITIPSYAVVFTRVDYELSKNWSLSLNLDNILDKKYYQGAGQGVGYNNWYGMPRSFTATLRARW